MPRSGSAARLGYTANPDPGRHSALVGPAWVPYLPHPTLRAGEK